MAISWDFTAAAKAQQASQAAAARDSANLQRSISQGFAAGQRNREARRLAQERQDKAALAQQQVIDKFNEDTQDTFNIPAGKAKSKDGSILDYDTVNDIFDYSSQQLVKTYTRIYNDKDMDRDQRALALKKLTNQIPLLKAGQETLNVRIAEYSQGALDGDISKAMEPEWQEMYSELADGSFKGGIDYIDGETRLIGKTSGGHDINLPLRDFQKNLPSVMTSAGSMTDNLDVVRTNYKDSYAKYLKDPKKNPLPVFDLKTRAAAIGKTIGELPGDGLKSYGMDVLNYTEEQLDDMVHKYMIGEVSRPNMPEKTLKSLTPEQQERFKNDDSSMSETEAMVYVIDDLAMEMAKIEKTYVDQTPYLKPYTPAPSNFDQIQLNRTNRFTQAIKDNDVNTVLSVAAPKGFENGEVIVDGNGNVSLKYDEITGEDKSKGKDGETIINNILESKSINLSDNDAVERMYKNFLKENNTAKTKGQIDNLWERVKDDVFKEIDLFAQNSLKQREINKVNTIIEDAAQSSHERLGLDFENTLP
jgi:hypothetical protein